MVARDFLSPSRWIFMLVITTSQNLTHLGQIFSLKWKPSFGHRLHSPLRVHCSSEWMATHVYIGQYHHAATTVVLSAERCGRRGRGLGGRGRDICPPPIPPSMCKRECNWSLRVLSVWEFSTVCLGSTKFLCLRWELEHVNALGMT